MEIVKIREDQFMEAVRLSEYAFQYKVPEKDLEKRLNTLKKHQIFGVLEDNQLIAKLHLLPFEVYLDESKWKMGGIAGVATYPEFRRKGLVKELLKDVLEKMKAGGYTVSMLHPFSVPFYRKYGWELLTNRLKCSLTKTDLIQQETAPGTIKRYIENAPLEDISSIYEQYAEGFSGMLVRDNDWWKHIMDDEIAAIYYDVQQQPKGYILYTVKESKMKVEEFVPLDPEARRGLWNFICQHDSMIQQLEITTHVNEPLLFALENPQIKQELNPYFMVRIVDVEAFLQQYRLQWPDEAEELIIQISDSYAPWNEKTYLLKEKQVTILPAAQEDRGRNVIKMSVNTLSAVTFGYKRPSELYQIGRITGAEEEIQKLEKLIPHHTTFFYDFF